MARVDCWSCKISHGDGGRGDRDEMVEQMLLAVTSISSPISRRSIKMNRWRRIQRSIASALAAGGGDEVRRSAWNGVVESLMHRHPGSQLPDRLIAMIRRHFESLPSSYAQAGFDSESVFLHIRLLEQARSDPDKAPAIAVKQQQQKQQNPTNNGEDSSSFSSDSSPLSPWRRSSSSNDPVVVVSFAAVAMPMSKQAIEWAFKRVGAAAVRAQVFDRKPLLLGVVSLLSPPRLAVDRVQALLKAASKRSSFTMRLKLGLSENSQGRDQQKQEHNPGGRKSFNAIATSRSLLVEDAELPGDTSRLSFAGRFSVDCLRMRVDRQGNVVMGRDELAMWALDPVKLRARANVYGGQAVVLEPLLPSSDRRVKQVEEYEIQREVLAALCCRMPHRNLMPILGICFDVEERQWLVVYKQIPGCIPLRQRLANTRLLELNTILSIARDIAEGMKFLHECGVVHSQLSTTCLLLDDRGVAVIGGLKLARLVVDPSYGRQPSASPWQAPELASVDCVITPKTDVYCFGVVLWELTTCHLDSKKTTNMKPPDVPADCSPLLRYLMRQCWASNPLDRPDFCEILDMLASASSR